MIRAALLVLLLAACAPLPVRVRDRTGRGWGVPTGPYTVLTVYHLADPPVFVEGAPAEIVQIDYRRPEALVTLRTSKRIPPPYYTVRPLRHGDSGSPLTLDGETVGLVSGFGHGGGPLFLVPTRVPE